LGARIEVGAIGWKHTLWREDFYPDELPEEWELSYYANEFRCVLVPHADWFDLDKDGIAQWYEDVHEVFSFIAEYIPGTDAELNALPVLERIGVLGDRLHGIVIKLHDGLSISSDAVKAFLRELVSSVEVYVDTPASQWSGEHVELLTQLGCKACWNNVNGQGVRGSCLGIIQSKAVNNDLRVMREEVQKFLDQLDDCSDACLLIDGSPPPVQLMRDTMVILSLLDA
jgi:hypothetical protein